MALTEKARESATENENNRGSDNDYDSVDIDGVPQIQLQPGTLVTGVVPEGEGNPVVRFPPFDDDAKEVGNGGNVGIVLDDPEIVVDEEEGTEDTIILHDDSGEEYWDYRLYNTDRHGTNYEEGIGVEFDAGQGSRLYKGDVVDTFDEDRVLVMTSGGAAVSVAKTLDVRGGLPALYDYEDEYEGYSNGGLVEYALRDDEGNPVDIDGNELDFSWRYTRYTPELRDDLYGQRVGILMDWWTNSVIYEELDEDGQDRYDNIVDGGEQDSFYYTLFDVENEEVLSPIEDGEYVGGYLRWRYDPDGRLPEDQYEFVQDYVDQMDDFSEETIRAAIEEEGDFEDDPQTEDIVNRIQELAE